MVLILIYPSHPHPDKYQYGQIKHNLQNKSWSNQWLDPEALILNDLFDTDDELSSS